MHGYVRELQEDLESAASPFQIWTWIKSQLQYYGSISSIFIMILLIGWASLSVGRQVRKYRHELASCLCGNFLITTVIQICTWDSWHGKSKPDREMISFNGEKSRMLNGETPVRMSRLNTAAQTPPSHLISVNTPMSVTNAPLHPGPWGSSPAFNPNGSWNDHLSKPNNAASIVKEKSMPKDLYGVHPLKTNNQDERGRSRSPLAHS